MASFFEVQNLHVEYRSRDRDANPALAGVSFVMMPGEILGVIGESGSGKSTLAATVLRLLPANASISGAVFLEGKDILQATSEELQRIRGKRISLINQEPSAALHPTIRVGEQVRLVIAAHESLSRNALRERVQQVLGAVFPEDVERISKSYPHQLSGGQKQRVVIAQAVACGPSLLIADEPTASLDPTTQMEILSLFRKLRDKLGMALILITHNPALLPNFAHRTLVLYGGRIAELGPTKAVLSSPQHPYTRALLSSIPKLFEENGNGHKTQLPAISGDLLASTLPSGGCPFEPRCSLRMNMCANRKPTPVTVAAAHAVSCFKFES
jgi:oligopeptide/dipeptide ABC transporter ATP-binding protein